MSRLPRGRRVKPTFLEILTPFPLNDASMPLSRFVRDPYRPNDAFAPDKLAKTLLNHEDIYPIVQDSVRSFLTTNNRQSCRFLGFDVSKKTERDRELDAKKVCTYRLKQHSNNFNRVLAADGVKGEVVRLISQTRNGRLYMVVGFKTYVNASVNVEHRMRRTLSVVSAIAAMAIVGHGIEIGADSDRDGTNLDSYRGGEDQEIVFAMEYKVVKDKKGHWLKNIGELTLKGNVAEVTAWGRGVFGDGEEEEDDDDEDEDEDENEDENGDENEDGELADDEDGSVDDGEDEDLLFSGEGLESRDIEPGEVLLF